MRRHSRSKSFEEMPMLLEHREESYTMTYQEVAFSATRMPVPKKLALLEVWVHSLREELPTGESSRGSAEQISGAIKTVTPPDDDAIQECYTAHLMEKYG